MAKSPFDVQRVLFKARTTKRWWMPPALTILIVVNVYGLLLPRTYESSALVLIHKPPITDATTAETFRIGDVLDTIKQRIASFSFLAEVARQCNLDKGIDPRSTAYDKLIGRIRSSVTLNNPDNDFFQVLYQGYSPEEAYLVTDKIVKMFIAQSGEYYGSKAKRNVEFLKAQFKQNELAMADAQTKIRTYKDAHINEIPESQAEHMSRLTSIQAAYQATIQDLEGTGSALRLAQMQLVNVPKTFGRATTQGQDPYVTQLKTQESQLRTKLETMLDVQGFTDEHWEVRATRKQLALTQAQLTSATQATPANISVADLNPVYTNLQTTITSYQLKYGELQRRLIEQKAAIAVLQAYLDQIPKHQDDLKTLERNYSVAAAQVDFFRAQLNLAQRANDLESEGMGPSYEIKDPPRVPTSPSGPKIVKYAVVGMFLGGAAAAGIIFLFVLFDGSLRSVEEARGILRMPILGLMQQIVSPRHEVLRLRRRRGAWVGVGMVAAALIVVGAIGYYRYHGELSLDMDNLRDYLKRR